MHPYVPTTIRRLKRLLKGMSIGMLTTQSATGETHSRPMLVHGVDESGWLWFLTDRSSRKACELIQNPQASVTFQSSRGDRYVSVSGTAVVVRDDVSINRWWNPTYRAWFPKGKSDPELVLVAMRVSRAEFWLVPRSRVTRVLGAAKAVATGRRYEAGQHGTLELAPAF
jgi:general stress protein 26